MLGCEAAALMGWLRLDFLGTFPNGLLSALAPRGLWLLHGLCLEWTFMAELCQSEPFDAGLPTLPPLPSLGPLLQRGAQ